MRDSRGRFAARLIRRWLEEKHNGLSGHATRDRWDTIEADIQRAVLWQRQENYPESTTRDTFKV